MFSLIFRENQDRIPDSETTVVIWEFPKFFRVSGYFTDLPLRELLMELGLCTFLQLFPLDAQSIPKDFGPDQPAQLSTYIGLPRTREEPCTMIRLCFPDL